MSTTNHWTIYDSPIGRLTLVGGPAGLSALRFPEDGGAPLHDDDHDPVLFTVAVRQLDEYFAGRREGFGLRLDLRGTPFQRAVWDELQRTPCGSTTTYAALARAVGRPGAVRAVGAAVGRTPVPIVVPCHRAIGSDGSLTGYRGGLPRKRALLDLERRAAGELPASGSATAAGEAPTSGSATAAGEPPASGSATAAGEPPASGSATAAAPFSLPQLALL